MTEQDIQGLREKYVQPILMEGDMLADPYDEFHNWFLIALTSKVLEANAMSLATVDDIGQPTVRTVLYKGLSDNDGICFYTNYDSKKASDIANNNRVSLLFNWLPLQRQIRIDGIAKKLSRRESEQYFHRRPRGSQIGAWASKQSSTILNRAVLEQSWANYEKEFEGLDKIPMPENWGGYEVIPTTFEFWQGNDNRLHDRFQYTLNDSSWSMRRLAP